MIEKFDSELMERYLAGRGWQYFRSGEGDFLVLLAADSADLHLHFRAEGPERDVFVVRVTTAASYPACATPPLTVVVSEWNREHYWPKAYLGDDESRVRVYGEAAYPLGDGVHWELFVELATTAIDSACALFEDVVVTAEGAVETAMLGGIYPA